MKYDKRITLHSGVACILRHAEVSDAEAVLSCISLTRAQTENMLCYPDEGSLDILRERQFLLEKETSGNQVELCAVVDGVIVGTAGIKPVGEQDKVKHRAEFGVGIDRAHWGRGIGRALTLACIECAKAAGYRQLELDVVSTNERAAALYASVGFVEYGRNPKGFRTRAGQWQELVLMRLDLAP